jgi:hypothetical protein
MARWALVLPVLLCVGCCAWTQSSGIDFVEGAFSETIRVDFQATTLADVLSSDTRFDLRINWMEMDIESELHLTELQSSSLQITTWAYAGAMQVMALLGFDMVKPESHFLQLGWEWNAFGATYGPTFLLVHNPWDPTPEDLKMDFKFQGQTVAGMVVTMVATFGNYVDPTGRAQITPYAWPNTGDTDGVCDLPFVGAEIQVNYFAFCCAEPSILISFDASGFDNAMFSVSDVRIENLPWLTLSGSLTYALDEKSMIISPMLDFGEFEGCLSVTWAYSGVTTGNPPSGAVPTVESIDISGIRLECSLGSINIRGEIRAASSDGIEINNYNYDFDPKEDCCNVMMWSIGVRFFDSSDSLFDVSSFRANLRYLMSERFMWLTTMYVNTNSVSPSISWTFGFEIRFRPS